MLMNSFTFYTYFIFFCALSYLPSIWTKFIFSRRNYTDTKYFIAILYGLTISYIHWRFAQTGKLPFFGTQDRSAMGWISLFMIFAHAYAIPWPWRPKRKV